MEKFTVEKLMELSLLPAYHFPWLVTHVCVSASERGGERERGRERMYTHVHT